jgi:2-oxoglutarate dehydrogenase E1 component
VGICLQNKSVRDRRIFEPSLDISNFGLSSADLNTVFDAGKIVGKVPSTLTEIIAHLDAIYCQHIGVEYMYIRKPEIVQWIQEK